MQSRHMLPCVLYSMMFVLNFRTMALPRTEMEVLYDLYTDTGGATTWAWKATEGVWNFSKSGDGMFVHDPCVEEWQGVTCSNSSRACSNPNIVCHLVELDLNQYNLQGTLPDSLNQLNQMSKLNFWMNSLSGLIPPDIGLLINLKEILLDDNSLTGEVPSSLYGLSKLVICSLTANILTGPISPEISQLVNLEYLLLFGNHISGSLASEIGDLGSLIRLDLDNNMMSNHLPTSLGQLDNLESIFFHSNKFSGPIVPELFQLTNIAHLYLFDNVFSGSIDSDIGQLVNLQSLVSHNNVLTGTLPSSIGALTDVTSLYLHLNSLSGSIVSELGQLTKLRNLYLYRNMFSGSLSPQLGNLTKIVDFSLYSNMLSGELVSEIGNLKQIKLLLLYDNMFTRSVPASVGFLTTMNTLYLHDNLLSGTLPSSFGNLIDLEELLIHGNQLHGSIPVEMSNCHTLRVLRLQNNLISGHLDNVFGSDMMMENIDLSDNRISGNIPQGIFDMPNVITVTLSLNCFEGRLPPGMCKARNISVLSMDGLGAARNCRRAFVAPVSGVTLFNTLDGSVPLCVWNLPQLRVLHMTGNGLTGSIGDIYPMEHFTKLKVLAIGHNKFSGTIPDSLLTIDFSYLDLSFNKLSGRYHRALPLNTNITRLYLEINRLSGRLSAIRGDIEKVSVVRGNLFSCSSIPSQDEFSEDYTCGSEDMDVSLYIITSVVLLLILSMYFLSRQGASRFKFLSHWSFLVRNIKSNITIMTDRDRKKRNHDSVEDKIYLFVAELATTTKLFKLLLGILLVVCVPIYCLKIAEAGSSNTTNTTHSQQYRWILSLAYLRGHLSMVMIMILWITMVSALRLLTMKRGPFRKWFPWDVACNGAQGMSSVCGDTVVLTSNDDNRCHAVRLIFFILFFNCAINSSVNGLYIYLTSQSLSPMFLIMLQAMVAMFNVMWNMAMIPLLSKPLKDPKRIIRIEVLLLLVNNIILPCVVTALTSPACFQGLLIDPDQVTSTYDYTYCRASVLNTNGTRQCALYAVGTVSVAPLVPPFSYNNMCSSVILTNFIPVYILVYAIAVVTPILFVLVFTSFKVSNFPSQVSNGLIPGIFWPDHWTNQPPTESLKPYNLLKVYRIVSFDVLNHFLVFFTFGLCSPFLALSIILAVFLKHNMWQMLLGRFVLAMGTAASGCAQTSPKLYSADRVLASLSDAYLPVLSIVSESVWLIICGSALFFSFLCWDVIGDEVGSLSALWAPLFVITVPVALRVIVFVIEERSANSKGTRIVNEERDSASRQTVEMNPIHQSS